MISEFATHGRSLYPRLWDGCVAAYLPSAGATGSTLFDYSGNALHGTFNSMDPATDWVATGGGGLSLDFDGSNDFVQATNIITDYPLSISFWARVTAIGTKYAVVLTNSADTEMRLGAFFNNTIPTIIAYNTSGNNQTTGSGFGGTQNLWAHIAVVFHGAASRFIYVRGTTKTSSTASVSVSGDMSRLLIGSLDATSATTLTGQIDDIRIYNRALSDGEVLNLSLGRGVAYEPRRRKIFQTFSGSAPPAASYKPRKTFSRVIP